ncbi:hypothetical protein [Desulfosporosinus lacus]|uniref:Uncharacterized protein n=1 Tax=Desulfosporosinus lacus DSM 15449 TaxID=1121420 RepID=A0A1M6HEX2_9FIRM|nr:hypothetical protein [Desulfosporosinus lacus]SHJ20738.1 hypothetical protein SAMN02746098_05343 [Desulfosporosinus lacus DSM 15449]
MRVVAKNIKYWSNTCDRKSMAEEVAQGVNEIYDNLQKGEVGKISRNLDLQATAENRSFVTISSEDFWADGQWLSYWEERMKAFGVVVQPEGLIMNNKGNSNE